MKRYVSIIIQIWITPTCAKCDDMWEEPGLGRAGQDHHRGRDHAPMCWPTPGCRGHRAAELNTAILSRYLCVSHQFPPAMKIPPKTKYCRHSSLGALHCVLCGHRAAEEQDISMSQVSSFQCSSWLHTVPYPNFMVLIFKLHTYAKTLKISTTDMVRTAAVQQDCTVRMLREVWRIFS